MGYVAARGGAEAIEQAEHLARYFRLRGGTPRVALRQIQALLRCAVEWVLVLGAM